MPRENEGWRDRNCVCVRRSMINPHDEEAPAIMGLVASRGVSLWIIIDKRDISPSDVLHYLLMPFISLQHKELWLMVLGMPKHRTTGLAYKRCDQNLCTRLKVQISLNDTNYELQNNNECPAMFVVQGTSSFFHVTLLGNAARGSNRAASPKRSSPWSSPISRGVNYYFGGDRRHPKPLTLILPTFFDIFSLNLPLFLLYNLLLS